MTLPRMKQVTIIGVGLLGGSVGLAIKALDPRVRVAGVGRRQSSLDEALKVGAIDSAHMDAAIPAKNSDLVILATPVGAFSQYLKQIAPILPARAIVTDVGSTKAQIVAEAAKILGPAGAFVGSHPMAGSEKKGPSYSTADLLKGAKCIVTPTPNTPEKLTRTVERFWRALGMNVLRMTPRAHDQAVAAVSHLPHAVSALLMMLPATRHLPVAATGLRDMTRLSGGDPEVWRDIFLTNRSAILAAIDDLDESLMQLRDLVDVGDADAIERLLAAARARRKLELAPQENL